MVSGSISLLCSRFFSPFPHGTGSLSVSGEYLALADGPAGFTQGSSCPALLRILIGPRIKSYTGLSPSVMQLSRCFYFDSTVPRLSPTTPILPKQYRFRLFPFRSPLLRESHFVFFSYGYLDVSVPHVRLPSKNGMIQSSRIGLPHSEICGSIRICQSPQLIAAYHVLHRLPEPRHPPCALIHFLFADRICFVHLYKYSRSKHPSLINTSVFCS